MNSLFVFLFLLSIVGLIVGLIKPVLFNKLFKGNANRKNISLAFGIAIVLFFILIGVTSPKSNSVTQQTNSQSQQPSVAENTTVATVPVVASGSPASTVAAASAPAVKTTAAPKVTAPTQPKQNQVQQTVPASSPTASAPQTTPPAPTPTPTPTPAPTPPPSPAPITLSGSSQQATQPFNLQQGLSIFTLHNSGQQNFIVYLLDNQGNQIALLSNAIGDFSGSKAVQIPSAGSYLLNVQSDGSWSITITQPRVSSAPSVSTLNGVGNQATQFFNLSPGLHTFTLTNSGSGNFIVYLEDKNGNQIDLIENVIGDFSGSKAEHIDESGPYFLDIQSSDANSSGTWAVTIK